MKYCVTLPKAPTAVVGIGWPEAEKIADQSTTAGRISASTCQMDSMVSACL